MVTICKIKTAAKAHFADTKKVITLKGFILFKTTRTVRFERGVFILKNYFLTYSYSMFRFVLYFHHILKYTYKVNEINHILFELSLFPSGIHSITPPTYTFI